MSFKAFFDGPHNYKKRICFYEQGGSPKLLEKLIETIDAEQDNITEINLSWYLYNNSILHNYLKKLSINGIKVNVVTIPLEGYDHSKPQRLEDLFTGKKRKEGVTKYSLAKDIFAEMYYSDTSPNFNIYFFPHLYVRSPYVNKFSRGALPYSLHVKSAFIKKKSGSIIVLSSSNLAMRDLVKYESMICIQDEVQYEAAFASFYNDLIRNSIHIKNYRKSFNTTCNTFDAIDFKTSRSSFITSPFYRNSANILDKTLTEYILSAKERILICAQHLAAFNYEFNGKYHSTLTAPETRQGILGAVITMANKGVQVTCLSQTFAPPDKDAKDFETIKFRSPLNKRNFQQFYAQLSRTKNAEYFVNGHLHSKFIIIDNLLIYCTYNFTPTQFIYLDKVKIPNFKNMPELSYEGIHCEVAMHVVIKNEVLLKLFEDHIDMIKNDPETIKIK